ncbi:hypothetical protein IWW51_006203 [Coemansia sp. RSA 2702]|nr:hypothetical protein IWW51_006203 [Coemansia sp. RSA 2702]
MANLPNEIQFRLKDAAQGLTYSADAVEFIFEDDPEPVGTDDGQTTVVVEMSADGTRPVGVQSLSASLMVSDFKWERQAEPTASLTVESISLEQEPALREAQTDKLSSQQIFSNIQRDSHHLSKRVALLKRALDNLEPPAAASEK